MGYPRFRSLPFFFYTWALALRFHRFLLLLFLVFYLLLIDGFVILTMVLLLGCFCK